MTSSAPRARRRLAFASLEVFAMTRAPNSLANCSANSDTPPEPRISTVCPASRRRAPVSAFQAVTPAPREGRGFFERKMVRNPDDRVFMKNGILSQHPIERATNLRGVLDLDGTVTPIGKHRGGHPVANRDATHVRTYGGDLARAVGAHDHIGFHGQRIRACQDRELSGGERVPSDANQHRPTILLWDPTLLCHEACEASA